MHFSEGVVRSGPVESMERKKSGDLCACDIYYCENSSRKNEDITGLVLEEVGDETTVEFTVELGGGAEPLAAVSRDRDDGTGEG